MIFRSHAAVVALVMLLIVGPLSLYGDEARVGNAVAKLFDVGWGTSSKSAAEAERWFELAKQYEPGDRRIAYTYALVLMKHRDYKDALITIDRIIAADPKNLAAIKAKIWLDVITKNYNSTLTGIQQLSNLLGELIADEGSMEEQKEVVRYLGRIIGYLEGPVKGAISDTLLSRYEGKIADHLSGSLESIFEEARRGVEEQFTALSLEKEKLAANSKVDAEKERQKKIDDLQKQGEDILIQRSNLNTQDEKIRRESQSAIDKIEAEDKPIVALLGELEIQVSNARRERFRAANAASQLRALFDRTNDPVIRSSVLLQMNQNGIIATQYDVQLNNLERRADQLFRQRGDILRRLNLAKSNAYKLLNKNKAELAALDKSEKKIERDKKKASKPVRGISSRARNLATQAAAFTTYEQFPLEEEKSRMLALFGKE